MLYWGSGREECHQGAVKLWLVPSRQVHCESRAMGEAHQEGALDGATGAPSPPCVLTFFSSSCPINLSSPPPSNALRSTCHFMKLLFIYMNNYINKYRTLRLFSHPGDCYHCIFFYPLYFCLWFLRYRNFIHENTHSNIHMVHIHPHSCISFQPCHCHPHTFLSPRTQSRHAQPRSPVSTTALNLILRHHWMVSLWRQDAHLNLLNVKKNIGYHWWWIQFHHPSPCYWVHSESSVVLCDSSGLLLRPGAAEERLWLTAQPFVGKIASSYILLIITGYTSPC